MEGVIEKLNSESSTGVVQDGRITGEYDFGIEGDGRENGGVEPEGGRPAVVNNRQLSHARIYEKDTIIGCVLGIGLRPLHRLRLVSMFVHQSGWMGERSHRHHCYLYGCDCLLSRSLRFLKGLKGLR